MIELLDRKAVKAQTAALLETAQVSPKAMTALYLGLGILLSALRLGANGNVFSVFLSVLTGLLSLVLDAGFLLYCMAVRRGERAEYLTLFDGFGMAAKVVLLSLVKALFVFLWSLLFVIPGIIALYRYRFALYNLLEDPELDFMEALGRSKRQTVGYKSQLFLLDLSYLPWILLGDLLEIVYDVVLQTRMQEYLFTHGMNYADLWMVSDLVDKTVFGVPGPVWQILIAVWGLAIALFYLPNYYCVNLAYFDSAKRASGVGGSPDAPPAQDQPPREDPPYEPWNEL